MGMVYCELYAGGKYDNNSGENYEFSLGLNGLEPVQQYSSEFMFVTVFRDGYKYSLEFSKGENVGGLKKKKRSMSIRAQKHIGSLILTYLPTLLFNRILQRNIEKTGCGKSRFAFYIN